MGDQLLSEGARHPCPSMKKGSAPVPMCDQKATQVTGSSGTSSSMQGM